MSSFNRAAQQSLGSLPVAVALRQSVGHEAVLIHRTPKPVLSAANGDTPSSRCHVSPDCGARRRIVLASALLGGERQAMLT